MRDDELSPAEAEIPVDASEASEAVGVAEIEMTAPYLLPEDVAEALDRETLGGSTNTYGESWSERVPPSELPPGAAAQQQAGRSRSPRTSRWRSSTAVMGTARKGSSRVRRFRRFALS